MDAASRTASEKAEADNAEAQAVVRCFGPVTGRLLCEVPAASVREVHDATRRAREAQLAWGALRVEERCARIAPVLDGLIDAADTLASLLSEECGKPRMEALHEVIMTVDLARYYIANAPAILGRTRRSHHLFRHRLGYVHYAPLGVVGVVSPWNYPFAIPFGAVLAALIAGNGVVLKPSEITTAIALRTKEVIDRTSALPRDLLQVVPGGGAVGAALIDSGIDKLIFTGAVSTGRRVAAACGERLVPCVLELGGKAAAIVCADADVERAARAIVFGAFINSGQVCISVERAYVHASLYTSFVERVAQFTKELRQGDPSDLTVDVGSMTFEPQLGVVRNLVEDSVRRGARLVCGGKPSDFGPLAYEPTVLADCTQDMPVMRREIFGPVLPIMKVETDDEAVLLANDSELGLFHYVFSRSVPRARSLAERLHAGTVMINEVVSAYATAEAPFGGVRRSGQGRLHGEEGLREMCELRYVNMNRVWFPRREPFWFPYGPRMFHALLWTLDVWFRSGSLWSKIRAFFRRKRS